MTFIRVHINISWTYPTKVTKKIILVSEQNAGHICYSEQAIYLLYLFKSYFLLGILGRWNRNSIRNLSRISLYLCIHVYTINIYMYMVYSSFTLRYMVHNGWNSASLSIDDLRLCANYKLTITCLDDKGNHHKKACICKSCFKKAYIHIYTIYLYIRQLLYDKVNG